MSLQHPIHNNRKETSFRVSMTHWVDSSVLILYQFGLNFDVKQSEDSRGSTSDKDGTSSNVTWSVFFIPLSPHDWRKDLKKRNKTRQKFIHLTVLRVQSNLRSMDFFTKVSKKSVRCLTLRTFKRSTQRTVVPQEEKGIKVYRDLKVLVTVLFQFQFKWGYLRTVSTISRRPVSSHSLSFCGNTPL